jgi:hypothetical protein
MLCMVALRLTLEKTPCRLPNSGTAEAGPQGTPSWWPGDCCKLHGDASNDPILSPARGGVGEGKVGARGPGLAGRPPVTTRAAVIRSSERVIAGPWGLRAGASGAVLLQGPRLLPELRRPPYDRARGPPARRGPALGSSAPVGAHDALPPSLPAGLGPPAGPSRAGGVRARLARSLPAPRAAGGPRGRPDRKGDSDPALRRRAQPQPPLPHSRLGWGLCRSRGRHARFPSRHCHPPTRRWLGSWRRSLAAGAGCWRVEDSIPGPANPRRQISSKPPSCAWRGLRALGTAPPRSWPSRRTRPPAPDPSGMRPSQRGIGLPGRHGRCLCAAHLAFGRSLAATAEPADARDQLIAAIELLEQMHMQRWLGLARDTLVRLG